MDLDLEQQREHFNGIAEKYFSARNHPNHVTLKRLIWEQFFRRHPDLAREISSVIEPMCGMAEGFEILKHNTQAKFDYLGFDYSEAMVEIARKDKPDLRIEWGDVTTFSSPVPPADMIVLIGGLHHVYSRSQEVVANLTRALKPGGYFLSFEPTHNNWLARRARQQIYKNNSLFDNDTEQGFERIDLLSHFEKAGYEKVDEVSPGLAAYVLYYNPDAFPALNIGGPALVKALFCLDRLFWTNWIGRKMSFATITLWRASLR
jgi:SAM-dependent methyltransferase